MTEQEIFEQLKATFADMFEIEPSEVTLESKLYEDLDIDSIDAVDLIVQLRPMLGRRTLEPRQFHQLVTVGDVVKALHELLQTQKNPA
jgi:acyl carrier protein